MVQNIRYSGVWYSDGYCSPFPHSGNLFKRVLVHFQLPIIPVVISHYDFLDTNAKFFEPSNIRLRILDPIPTKGLSSRDIESFTKSVRDQMLEVFCSDELHDGYYQPPPKVDNEKTPLPNVARSL